MESLAQMGVQLLLFTLGLEFSMAKLRAVRGVALIGGVLQILATMVLAGVVASAIGASIHEGVFIGALVRVSSFRNFSQLFRSVINTSSRVRHWRPHPRGRFVRCSRPSRFLSHLLVFRQTLHCHRRVHLQEHFLSAHLCEFC